MKVADLLLRHINYSKARVVQAWAGPESSRRPRFPPIVNDIRHMNVVRLLVLRTGRLHLPENIPGTHFC